MIPWREWNLDDWNSRLLQHFFEKSSRDRGFAIVTLLVTKDELAKATGDLGSDPQVVSEKFVSAVLSELPAGTMLLDHAFELKFNPEFSFPSPPFVAHLILTCLAASESSDSLGNESSYRKRLNELTKGACPDKLLHFLIPLWKRLQLWLEHAENRSRYRQLVLPDPGTHTRIGYSELLAFPGRLDQRDLTEVLKTADMLGTVPPPGKVITVVARNISKFRKSFVEAFDEFRSAYHSTSADISNETLVNHRFWSAVVESCLRGRTSDDIDDQHDRFELIASFEDESFGLYLLSRTGSQKTPEDFDLEVLPEQTGPWVAALVDQAKRSSREPVNALFAGQLNMLRLKHIVSQGFLAFAPTEGGQYALARSTATLVNASHALVRDDLVNSVITKFGGKVVECAATVSGWKLIEGLRITTIVDAESSELRDIWLLQRQLSPRKIYLSAGIRSDDGWLGFGEVLPVVSVDGATTVFGSYDAARFPLIPASSGRWRFPFNDYNGVVSLVAFKDEALVAETSVKFIRSPASEEYKTPANLHAFYAEGQRGAVPLKTTIDSLETDSRIDMGSLTGRLIFLGKNQGEFVADEKDAAWKVIRSGRAQNYISLPDSPNAGEVAVTKADTQGMRRKWRTLVEQSTPISGHPDLEKRLNEVRRQLRSAVELSVSKFDSSFLPSIYSKATTEPAVEIIFLARALASRGAAKRGIPFADWKALVCAFTKLPEKMRAYEKCAVEALTRCWQEAGFIDVITSASWSGRTIFPIKPALIVMKSGPVFHATLAGLCLESTIRRACEKASKVGLVIEEKRSACRFVPAVSVFSSSQLESIHSLSTHLGIPIRWALVTNEVPGISNVEGTNPKPSNYDTQFRFRNWSLNGKEHPSTAMTFYKRDDRPAFWSIDESQTPTWSYSKNVARILACKAAGMAPFKARGEHEIIVEHAYLPLPFARYSAIAGPILPGPDNLIEGGEGHIYAFGTRQFRDQVLASATY